MKKIYLFLVMSLLCSYIFSRPSEALVLDFYDNIAAPTGFCGMVYYNYYNAPTLKDDSGKSVKTSQNDDLDMSVNVVTVRPAYFFKALNLLWAFNAIVPFGEVKARNFATGEKEKSRGLGDIAAGPAVFLFQHEKSWTYISFWEFVSMPTGDYSKRRGEEGGPNLGLNYWYLQHQLAFATSFTEQRRLSFDMNINYYQKFKTSDLEPGDSMEFEGIVGFGILDALRVGVYARYLFDLQKSTNFDVEYEKAKVFSAGPSIAYARETWGINLRYVHDFKAEMAPKGGQFFLRANYIFL